MKVRKQAVLFTMVVLFALNATVPVFAEDTAEKRRPIQLNIQRWNKLFWEIICR